MKTKNSNKAVAVVLNPDAIIANRISARWSNDEYQLAIQGIRKFGKDFKKIAEILGTKNESQINQFYTNYRKKFNLEHILKEFEEKQVQQQKQKITESDDDIMEVSKLWRVNDIDEDIFMYLGSMKF